MIGTAKLQDFLQSKIQREKIWEMFLGEGGNRAKNANQKNRGRTRMLQTLPFGPYVDLLKLIEPSIHAVHVPNRAFQALNAPSTASRSTTSQREIG